MKKASVEEKINSKIGIMKGKSFLDELEFVKYEGLYKVVEVGHKIHLVDNNESITPTTDKGHLDIDSVYKKLEKLQELEKQKAVQITDSKEEAKQIHIHEGEEEELVSTTMPMMLSKKAELIIPSPEIQFLENVFNFTKDETLFIKKYQYKNSETSQVLRFGINYKSKLTQEELDNYNQKLKTLLEQNPSDAQSNISNETKYKNFSEKYITLTSFEKLAIKNALCYLEHSKSNIALVDVFKRESKQVVDPKNKKNIITNVGEISLKELDTHTAILYKTTENKILVIDPNNPIFSAHIAKFSPNIMVNPTANDKYKIYAPIGNNTEIGKNLEEKFGSITGYNKDQYRDCIDIAVKIAFALKKDDTQYKRVEEIINSTAIKLITNNKAIDKISSENPIVSNRLKQASDYNKIIDSNLELKAFNSIQSDKDKKSLEDYNSAIMELKQNYDLQITAHNNEYIVGLTGLSEQYNEYMQNINIDEI